jgi:hypothetical protein
MPTLWRVFRAPRRGRDSYLAERVGFEPLLVVENKELTGIRLPRDLETLKTSVETRIEHAI